MARFVILLLLLAGCRDGKVAGARAYADGRRFYEDLRYVEARESLAWAVALDPKNAEAARLLQSIRYLLGEGEHGTERLDDGCRPVNVARTRAELARLVESGERRYAAGDWDGAIGELERAREMIRWFPYEIDGRGFDERAARLIEEARRRKRGPAAQESAAPEVAPLLARAAELLDLGRAAEARDLAECALGFDAESAAARAIFERAVAESGAGAAKTARVLVERKVTLNFPDVPLRDVARFLEESTGIRVTLAPGIDPDAHRVSLRLRAITIENALKIICDQTKLRYVIGEDIVTFEERVRQPGELLFEIYDISDLTFKPGFSSRAGLALPDPSAQEESRQLIFDEKAPERSEHMQDALVELVKQSTGGDDAWGEGTSIEPHRGQLLVDNTQEIHARIAEVLANLRRNQATVR